MVSISQGKGLFLGKCTGVSGGTTDPDFSGLCLSDGPLGVRASPYASAFPAGINAAASFDKEAIHRRGLDMGAEFRRKGANVQLGPAMNIARVPDAGRNWEGFGEVRRSAAFLPLDQCKKHLFLTIFDAFKRIPI